MLRFIVHRHEMQHNGTIMEVQNCDRQVPVSLDFEGSVSDAIDAAISAMEGGAS